MTPADQYRVKAGDMAALARAESDPFQKAEYERLSLAYLRLAKQADRNSQTDVVYEIPPAYPALHKKDLLHKKSRGCTKMKEAAN